jgi:hypothetical protein
VAVTPALIRVLLVLFVFCRELVPSLGSELVLCCLPLLTAVTTGGANVTVVGLGSWFLDWVVTMGSSGGASLAWTCVSGMLLLLP